MNLMWIIFRNKQKLAWQFLLKKPELDVNIVDNFGETALHVAARFNIAEAVEDLIKRKDVDINKRSFLGITAAILAAKCVSAEAFQVNTLLTICFMAQAHGVCFMNNLKKQLNFAKSMN